MMRSRPIRNGTAVRGRYNADTVMLDSTTSENVADETAECDDVAIEADNRVSVRAQSLMTATTTVVDTVPPPVQNRISHFYSTLGTGYFSEEGKVEDFSPLPPIVDDVSGFGESTTVPESQDVSEWLEDEHPNRGEASQYSIGGSDCIDAKPCARSPATFARDEWVFMRVSDFDLSLIESAKTTSSSESDILRNSARSEQRSEQVSLFQEEHQRFAESGNMIPNYHYAAADPPPGVEDNPDERYVALCNAAGTPSLIGCSAMNALSEFCYNSVMKDQTLWTPDGKTARLIQKNPKGWHGLTWHTECQKSQQQCAWPEPGSPEEQNVYVWHGFFKHGLHGSTWPVVRSAGIIPGRADYLFDVYQDSSRVPEYNRLSEGRIELKVLQESLSKEGPWYGRTKIYRAWIKASLLNRILEFDFIANARMLEDGSAFIFSTRAVTVPAQLEEAMLAEYEEPTSGSIIKAELLMGCVVFQRIDENRSLLINTQQVKSPLPVPSAIARVLGSHMSNQLMRDLKLFRQAQPLEG